MAAMARLLPLLALAAALAGCSSDRRVTGRDSVAAGDAGGVPHLVQRSRMSMGSPVDLSAWTAREADAVAAFEAAFDEFDRLDGLLSVWRRAATSCG